MDVRDALVGCGTVLLSLSALLGFAQYAERANAERAALWRVVHAGGTAGAVQLLALAAVWQHFARGALTTAIAAGIMLATLAFFLGPLARVLARPRLAAALLRVGAFVALPAYVALPFGFVF
jgi:hypothetical protein